MFNVIGFEVEVQQAPEELDADGKVESAASARCCVSPVVDGRVLNFDVFDAEGVLALGAEGGRMDIFTCSCGVAGCAGIHIEARIALRAGAVAWEFPEEPFRARFGDAFGASEPLAFMFEVGQYKQELAALIKEVESLRAACPIPFFVGPHGGVSYEEDSVPFAKQVAKRRARHKAWDVELARNKKAEGELSRWRVELEVAGAKASASLAQLAWSSTPFGVYGDEAAAYVAAARPALLADPEGAVRRLDPVEAGNVFWVDQAPAGFEWSQAVAAWGQAKVAIVEVPDDPWA